MFINHNKYPESGLIGITAHSVENFSWGSGEKLHEHYSEKAILAADCNLESDVGSIVVYANESGQIVVLDCDELQILWTIDVAKYFSDKMPKVTAICSALEREVVLGYSNGLVQSFIIKEQTQKHVLIAPSLFDNLEVPPAVHKICSSVIDRLIFTSYVNYSEGTRV